jgi:uncharacterized protein (TIGR02145 family)
MYKKLTTMKYIFKYIVFVIAFKLNSQTTVTDVSGNIYKTVKIGNQIWMAENLRTEKFRNGDPIEQITSSRYWLEISSLSIQEKAWENHNPAMCYYDNIKQKDNALYNWYVVVDERGICPTGFHVPSSEEYDELISYLGKDSTALNKLKSTTSWLLNGNNLSGFNAKAIGMRYGDANFGDKGEFTAFWTDSYSINDVWFYPESFNLSVPLNTNETFVPNSGYSVRCIKN